MPNSVSAIICTRNRSRSLARALDAMAKLKLNGTRFELLVVDNGSSDDTRSVVSRYLWSAPFPVSYHFESRAGVSHARNCGLRNACGDILAFTDDDCYIHDNWAQALVEVFSDGSPRLIGGRVELFNKSHLPMTVKTDVDRQVMTNFDCIFGFMHGANMAFSRTLYEKIGHFDTKLGAGTALMSAEDTDYIYRAFRIGFPVTYEPTVAVDHDHGRSTQAEGKALEFGYTKGMGAIAAKHLIKGKTDLLKAVYWNLSGADLQRLRAVMGGAFRYVIGI